MRRTPRTLQGLLLVLLAGVALSSPTRAQTIHGDGHYLLVRCTQALAGADRSPDEALYTGVCFGTMIGIIDTNALYPVRFGDKSLFCHVAPIPAGQAAKIVVQYLREHPTRLQERGGA